MSDAADIVRSHYNDDSILGRVLEALAANGLDIDNLRPEDLYPLDQLHGRGLAATRDHLKKAEITADMDVLDLGCGIGGASRFLAREAGCRIWAIDLTPAFIGTARDLTRRCGLADKIDYRTGDALDLPYDDARFDHVWAQNVTMNIEDKTGLAREVARVLKPGGRFSFGEAGIGNGEPPHFPLPWSRRPEGSFLATGEEMRQALEAGGLSVVRMEDETELYIAHAQEMSRRRREEPPGPYDHVQVLGDDFLERARNSAKSTYEGRLVDRFVIAEKPGG